MSALLRRVLVPALAVVVLSLAAGCEGDNTVGAGGGEETNRTPHPTVGSSDKADFDDSRPNSTTKPKRDGDRDRTPGDDPSSDGSVRAQDHALRGTTWKIVAVDADGKQQSVPASSKAHLKLSHSGKVAGYGGCNGFGGKYTATASSVKFGRIMSTKRACASNKVPEQAIMSVLRGTVRYRIDGDRMTLTNSAGDRLRMRAT